MKIKFEQNEKQVELIRQMGSKNTVEALKAREAFAALLAPVVGEQFLLADTTSMLFRNITIDVDDDPSFPLDLYNDVQEGHFSVWTQSMPGGLPTNQVLRPVDEVKVNLYKLDSAISYNIKYARKARLDVVAKAIERLVQEVLRKVQNNAWSVLFGAIANTEYNGKTQFYHTSTAGQFTIDDMNKVLTVFRRVNAAWDGGTPIGGASRPTDMVVSPEIMEQLRAMAYNPINTQGGNRTTITANSQQSAGAVVALPDADRAAIFDTAGAPEFFGIALNEILELGPTQPYTLIFDDFMSGAANNLTAGGATDTFDSATDDLIIVVDAAKDFAFRVIEKSGDEGSVFNLENDDQYVKRQEKIGQYGSVKEGRAVVDGRPCIALMV